MAQERAYLVVQSILKDMLETARILFHAIIRCRAEYIGQEAFRKPVSPDDIATGVEAAGRQVEAVAAKFDKASR